MSILLPIRRHLVGKMFLTYLIIIVVTGTVVFTAAELLMPAAFSRHLAAMAEDMGDATSLNQDLFANFRRAVVDSLTGAILVATLLALVLSGYISRTVSRPIQRMAFATRRIAAGHPGERIPVNEAQPLDEVGLLAVDLNRMANALEQTERMRYQLIGDVAHDLRTPLTSIKAYMEGLIDGVIPADAATFAKIHREADRLQRLVTDLQELSRIEAGAVPLNIRPLSVSVLIASTVDRLAPQFQDKGVTISTEVPGGLPDVTGDEDRLGQVLVNIVGNALQFTPAGGQVTLSAWRERERVAIAVRDTGVGISAEHLPHLFDRFYRADEARSRVGGGSGIGLTIAKRLIESHGGTIVAYSDGPGRGSTFTVWLPVA